MTKLLRLMRCERAATAVEYGLIAALICLSAMGALQYFGGATTAMWDMIADKSSEAMAPK